MNYCCLVVFYLKFSVCISDIYKFSVIETNLRKENELNALMPVSGNYLFNYHRSGKKFIYSLFLTRIN